MDRTRAVVWTGGLAVALLTAGCSSRAGNPLRVATGCTICAWRCETSFA